MILLPLLALFVVLYAIAILSASLKQRREAAPASTAVPVVSPSEARLRTIEKRLGDLEVQTDSISFRMRLERRVNDEERQRRVDALVARENARDR